MKRYFILVLLVVVYLVSCNKKPVVTPSRADMLRTGHWTIVSGTVTMRLPNGADTVLNYMNFLPKCHQDDYFVFHGGNDGAVFSGGFKCSPADPDSVTFKWYLSNNNNSLNMYQGAYDFTYGIKDSILPFVFDTTSLSPLVLDTVHGVNDTAFGYTRAIVVLDTIWKLRFDSTGLQYNNLYNASIVNFTQSSFTLKYWIYVDYLDSTNHHTSQFIYTDPVTSQPDTLDFNPIHRKDTVRYSINYKNG